MITVEDFNKVELRAGTVLEVKENKKKGIVSILQALYCMRLKIRKNEVVILNFSILFCIVCAVAAPYLAILGCVLFLICGYRFSFVKRDKDFEKEDLSSKFHHAADNVKSSLGDMAKGFAGNGQQDEKKDTHTTSSYYTDHSAPKGSSVPQIKVPRRVDSQDGSVQFEEDSDGYSSATIE